MKNNKWLNGIMGVVVGDALGLPVQFKYREELKRYLIEDSNMGYFIEADNLWSQLIYKIQTGKFDISIPALDNK